METVSLNRREADVALRLSNAPPPGLVGRRLGTLAFAAHASPALVERVGADRPLSAYPWIGVDERMDTRWLEGLIKTLAPGAKVVARADEGTALTRMLVQQGVGIYFLPLIEGKMLGLKQVGPVLDQRMDVWLLTLPDLRRNSRVRAFLDHMGEALPPLLSG